MYRIIIIEFSIYFYNSKIQQDTATFIMQNVKQHILLELNSKV